MVRRASGLGLCVVAYQLLVPACSDSQSEDEPAAETGGRSAESGAPSAQGGASSESGGSGGTATPNGGTDAGGVGAPRGGASNGGASNGGAPRAEGGAADEGGNAGAPVAGGSSPPEGGSTGEAPSGEHCTPGQTIRTFPSEVVTPCYGDIFRHRLPNASTVQLEDFELETPTVAGERFAVSVRHQGTGPFTIELWGAHEECGVAEELLWQGPMVEGIQCGEFTPSASYSHLLYVHRKVRKESYSFSNPELTLCSAGSCPGGADGEGLEPGRTLTEGPLVVETTNVNTHRRAFDLGIGLRGRLVMLLDESKQPKGTANPVRRGFLRMPPDDRFGDAWYCVGEGSSIVESPEGDSYDVSLRGLTRLPDCAPGTGTLSVRSSPDALTVTSSFAELGGDNLFAAEQSCAETTCRFRFHDRETTESKHWLYLTPAESVGDPFMPTAVPTDVASATLFFQSTMDAPVVSVCATSGSILYDPMVETSIELDGVSDLFGCPGEPVEDDELDFTTMTR